MSNNSQEKLILALETGLAGGTISVLKAGKQIDFIRGTDAISKSEELLAMIEALLLKNDLKKKEIELIAVSDGPGSLTGLRIGLATAKGLANAFKIEMRKLSLLDALVKLTKDYERVVAGFYIPNNGLFMRRYKKIKDYYQPESAIDKISKVSENLNMLNKITEDYVFVFNEEVSTFLNSSKFPFEKKSEIIKGNPAEILALASLKTRLIMN